MAPSHLSPIIHSTDQLGRSTLIVTPKITSFRKDVVSASWDVVLAMTGLVILPVTSAQRVLKGLISALNKLLLVI